VFERITLDHQRMQGAPIDLGILAECLVFYEKVRVIVDQVRFPYLVRACGADELLHLLSMGALELEYFENLSGVMTRQIGSRTVHDSGNVKSSSLGYFGVARKLFDELAGSSGKGANKRFDKFQRFVKRSDYTNEMAAEGRADWLDEEYATEAARALLSWLAPGYSVPAGLKFDVRAVPDGFQVTSNIDFDSADAAYRQHNGGAEQTITEAYLLVNIANTRRDLIVGSQFSSEFSLAPAQALVASCKFAQVLTSANGGLQTADIFQEEVVDDLPRIKEAVNSGVKNFSDVIRLVESASEFKAWLRKQESGDDIRKAYLRDVAHLDWADKLPPKSFRWLLFTGAGIALSATTHPLIGTMAGTALSAADTFILDRFVKGWKPNQFTEGPLKKFLQG